MESIKFIRGKEKADQIWRQRSFYRFENFNISDLCKVYLSLYPKSIITSRRNHYDSFIKQFRNERIKDLNTSSLGQWFNEIRLKENLTDRTLAQVRSQLSPFFKWLVTEEILKANPLLNIKFKRNAPPKRARCIFAEIEIKKILDHAYEFDKNTFYPFLYAVIQTGARRSEIAKLKWEHVDLSNGLILFKDTKNGTDRKIRMPKMLHDLIAHKPKTSKYVFPNSKNQILGRSSIQRTVVRFKSLYPTGHDWRLHDFRHSYANNFLKKGGEMYELQAMLGHKSIQMTVDLYGNLKSQDIRSSTPYDF
ncbi:MAG: site-specific integrase [Bacteriovoracaceae bacterium]|nr:site-specific integrase [Bacteriovoracaceae bacterium]